jgi:hypothetical protein
MPERISRDELLHRLRTACAEAGGIKSWAEAHDIPRKKVSDILRMFYEPQPKVYLALGYRRVVMFEKIERG